MYTCGCLFLMQTKYFHYPEGGGEFSAIVEHISYLANDLCVLVCAPVCLYVVCTCISLWVICMDAMCTAYV